MPTTFVEYMAQKSKLKMEVTGIERLIEYVKTFTERSWSSYITADNQGYTNVKTIFDVMAAEE